MYYEDTTYIVKNKLIKVYADIKFPFYITKK